MKGGGNEGRREGKGSNTQELGLHLDNREITSPNEEIYIVKASHQLRTDFERWVSLVSFVIVIPVLS